MDNAELNMILSKRVESNDADVLEVFRKLVQTSYTFILS
jgi:hypothetical protein